ncbi:tetratricopeptide repeat protein 22-like [Branchiostoma lanceolatum]|uniref:tetratricopeptide repeat protein 22-like n=1 Tax=Branchiostoma lanceolatum TaxID=7740 RepID=UPI0034543921
MFPAPANMAEGGDNLLVPKPGFFHLDLFVKDTKDVSPWYDELKTRLDQETGPMESAMTNLLGVFAFYNLRDQGKARKLLESVAQKDENNLNAIANKQFIYGHLMRAKDEMACRDRLQELLSDKSDAARARNARCFAEQGYALAFDVRDDSKDMVSKMRRAISWFESALNLVDNAGAVTIEELLVWKFYLSKCYLRLDQVSGGVQHKAPALTRDDMLKGFIVTRKLLIEVTKLDPTWKHGRFYVARAWAMLGGLESKCNVKVECYETPEYLIKEIPKTKGAEHIGPHVGCFEKAVEINPNDSEIYRRCGHMYLVEHLYENARRRLDKSIDIMPAIATNWVAYYIRSLVNMRDYEDKTKQAIRTERPLPSKELLNRAKDDAIASCKGAATPFNNYQLGKVCHRLAIHPVTEKVEDWDELDDALDHFAVALQLEDGFTNPEIQAARGKSLEVAGEHGKAAESYKRAVENDADNTTYLLNLHGVLKNLLILHRNVQGEHYVNEMAFWITEGFKKYADITPVLRECVLEFASQMIQVCQHLIDRDNAKLARMCLECFEGIDNDTCRTDAESMLSSLSKEASGIDDQLMRMSVVQSEQETRVKIPVTVEKPRHGQEFQYDFFVSHSSKDADWVNFALLPALEVESQFKGCVADRDFELGESVFDNIIHSIENSYKTLLILTPNFVTSEWCKYETEQALYERLETRRGCVIPILLEKCDVPKKLRTITYFDVSSDVIGSYDWLRLKKALEQAPLKEN